MLTITIQLNAPFGNEQGIKEGIAMYLERFGDVKVISISSDQEKQKPMEQLRMGGV